MPQDSSHSYAVGDRVRFTADSLGLIDPNSSAYRFRDETVGKGDEGEILRVDLPDGWLAVYVAEYPGCFVPVHPGMIEPA